MRGNDYMSASSKKKLRKEQAAGQMTEKQQNAQKEAKKLKAYTVTFVVIMVLVVCIALGTVAVQLVDRSGVIPRNTNAVTIGSHKLTSAQLNYFYVDAIDEQYKKWYNSYGNYTSMYVQLLYSLDFTQPLNKQKYPANDTQTWADFFADAAVEEAKSVYTLYDRAVSEGYQLPEEDKTNLNNQITNMETYGKLQGYGSLGKYLKTIYDNGAEESTYREYLEITAIANAYYAAHADSLKYDNAAWREYEKDHFAEFSSYSFASAVINNNDFLTGGTKDENGSTTYSDQEKADAAKAAAEAAESMKKEGITSADLLDKAIAKLEVYQGSDGKVTKTCSRSEDVLYGNIAEALQSWLADSSRKPGDFTVIPNVSKTTGEDGKETETTTGYNLVVFEGKDDNTMHLVNVRHILSGFKGGTTNSSTGQTVYTEAEKQAALDAINKVQDTWKAGEATEESFAALVKANTADDASADNGGLYENVYPGQMVSAFNDWCFDSARKPGDVGVVQTDYGYHLIYFVGQDEMTYRDYMIDNTLRSNDMTKWYDGLMENVEATNINTSKLSLDYTIAPQY